MSRKRGCPDRGCPERDSAAIFSSGTGDLLAPKCARAARADTESWEEVEKQAEKQMANLAENRGNIGAAPPTSMRMKETPRRASAEHALQAIAASSHDLLSGTSGRALSRPPTGNSFNKDGGTRVTGPSGDAAQAIIDRCSEQGQLALSLCLQQCSELMLDHDAVEAAVVALRTPQRASKNVLQGGAASVKLVAAVRMCLRKVHQFLEQAKAFMIQQPQLEAAERNRAAATKSRELRPLLSLLACTDEEPADAEEVETFNAPLLSNEAALEVEQTAEESLVEKASVHVPTVSTFALAALGSILVQYGLLEPPGSRSPSECGALSHTGGRSDANVDKFGHTPAWLLMHVAISLNLQQNAFDPEVVAAGDCAYILRKAMMALLGGFNTKTEIAAGRLMGRHGIKSCNELFKQLPKQRPAEEPSEADLTVDPEKASEPRLRALLREHMAARSLASSLVAGEIDTQPRQLSKWLNEKPDEGLVAAVRAYLKREASAPPVPEPEPLDCSFLADVAVVDEATLRERLGKYMGETGETPSEVARSWSTFNGKNVSKDLKGNKAALRRWIIGEVSTPATQAVGRKVRTFLEEVYQQSLVEASSAPSKPPAADPNDNPDEASEAQLCALLRTHMKRPDVTQDVVANACDCSRQSLSEYLATGAGRSCLDTEKVREYLKHAPPPPKVEPPGVVHFFLGAGIKGDGGYFFHYEVPMYQSDLSKAGIHVDNPDPAILKTPIGEALNDLAKEVGAYTHKPHSVSQPATSPAKRALIIREALVKALGTEANLSSACGGSAVIMAQPFVMVYKGELFGRPDMVAFAREHEEIRTLLSGKELAA